MSALLLVLFFLVVAAAIVIKVVIIVVPIAGKPQIVTDQDYMKVVIYFYEDNVLPMRLM